MLKFVQDPVQGSLRLEKLHKEEESSPNHECVWFKDEKLRLLSG